MNSVATGAIFLAALLVTTYRGPGAALAVVYLPALILFSKVPAVQLSLIPDAIAPIAAVYGILSGSILRGRGPSLRLTSVDWIVALLLVVDIVSAANTGNAWGVVSVLGSNGLQLVAPYFIVRCTFWQRDVQRLALRSMMAIILFLLPFALIEMRLWPRHFDAVVLANFGVVNWHTFSLPLRFSLFRATTSFMHAIDLGLGAGLIFGSILVFALQSRLRLWKPWIAASLGAAFFAMISALSFTSFVAFGAAALLYCLMRRIPSIRTGLVPGVIVMIGIGFLLTYWLAHLPVTYAAEPGNAIASSFWTRHTVISVAWDTATKAGFFGWGWGIEKAVDMESCDNAYLLIAMTRGWLGLGLWLLLPVCLAVLVSRGLRAPRSVQQAQVIVIAFSAVVGTMIGMYTVWFGFTYASLFMIMTGLAVNSAQAPVQARARVATRRSERRGMEGVRRLAGPTRGSA